MDKRWTARVSAVAGLLVCAAWAGAQGAEERSANRAALGLDGRVSLLVGAKVFGAIAPQAANRAWQFAALRSAGYRQEGDGRKFFLRLGESDVVSGAARIVAASGGASANWRFTASESLDAAALGVTMDIAAGDLIGGTWKVDRAEGAAEGTFPDTLGETHLFTGSVRAIEVRDRTGRGVRLAFAEPTPVLIQDNRRWSQSFAVRVGSQGMKLEKGGVFGVAMAITAVGVTGAVPMSVSRDGLTVIRAGDEWIPLKSELEIEAGSVLDLTHLGFVDAPAGKHGPVVVNSEGRFAFANSKEKAQRFYGVNFCFGAQFLSKQEVDTLADRLVRLGYNTIRIHHYEGGLTDGKPGLNWDPAKLDQLDYLVAAMKKRGIYVTTDLYVSRPVSAQQVGMPGDDSGGGWAYKVKVLVPVHEPAMEDWKAFSRKLLEHVNPYTGVRWGDEPAMAWLSLINEGNVGNYWNDVKGIPQWTTAWNAWLSKRYAGREALAAAWGPELKAEEAWGQAALPGSIHGDTPRHRDCKVFIADVELDMYRRMVKFLREEIRTPALLTNLNAWTNHVPNQKIRAEMDYVDDHFYVDHPEFIERDWSLPSRSGNQSPVMQGAPGGRGGNLLRVWGKPFTVSEYNYSGPGRFRGVGGILTGAMGALQGWDVIWRFAYSHGRESMFRPEPINYFDLARDPLNQAADRAAVMLYLRGDLAPAKGKVAVVVSEADLKGTGASRLPQMGEGPNFLAWVTGIGSVVGSAPPAGAVVLPTGLSGAPASGEGAGLVAFGTDTAKLMTVLRSRGILTPDNPTDPSKNIFQSDTGEMLLDGTRGLLRFDTPRTAGGYAEPGVAIESPGAGVTISDLSIGATVFVTSVDDRPIQQSGRLLVTHLTDLQNTETTYAEQDRQTLLEWGKLPYLVRAGSARVSLAVSEPAAWTVYAVSTSGRRQGEVASRVVGDRLEFVCEVRGPEGARMLYEVVRK